MLERYVIGNMTMHIGDEARYWFQILSMTTPSLWYNVSLQCSYCDCQDLTSKCKHLLENRMIIEIHMPSLCGSLPFIDHATQMQMDDFMWLVTWQCIFWMRPDIGFRYWAWPLLVYGTMSRSNAPIVIAKTSQVNVSISSKIGWSLRYICHPHVGHCHL